MPISQGSVTVVLTADRHPFQHALLNTVDQGIGNLFMGNMPPPEQCIGILEELLA